jgi:hypothetical protein
MTMGIAEANGCAGYVGATGAGLSVASWHRQPAVARRAVPDKHVDSQTSTPQSDEASRT